MPKRRALFLALLASSLFGAGLVLVYTGRYQHCTTEELSFTTADGVRIRAVLYLPRSLSGTTVTVDRRAPGRILSRLVSAIRIGVSSALAATDSVSPPTDGVRVAARGRIPRGTGIPAVVFTHSLLTAHEHYETAYSLEISKRGMAVLALDYRGHGDSGGRMFDIPMLGLERPTWRVRSQPDLIAAYEYLLTRPEIDPTRIAFVGHSMGGLASADAAMELRDRAWATVSIGATPLYADVDYPLDFYLLLGARDEIFRPDLGREAIARATDGAVHQEGILFGQFDDGTARKLDLIPALTHVGEVFSSEAARLTIQWLESAFYPAPRGEIHLTIVPRLIGLGLIVVGIWIGFVPFLALTERLCLGRAPTPSSVNPGVPTSVARRRAAGLTVLYLLAWSTAPVTGFVLLIQRPFRTIPILMAGPILALLCGGALNLGVLGLLVQVLSRRWARRAERAERSDASSLARPESRRRPSWPRRLAYGLLPFLYLFATVNLGLDRHFMDYWPNPRRFLEMAALAVLLAPALAMNEWWLRRWILPLAGTRATGIVVPVGMISGFYLSLKLLLPMHLGLYVIAITFFLGFMLLSIAYARPSMYRREVAGPWLFHVLTSAWILGAHLPLR